MAGKRFKSEPLKYKLGLPGGSSAGAPSASNRSVSRTEVRKGRSISHLNSSASPIDNGKHNSSFKSRTSSGSTFYSKVVARQVSEAAKQAAERAKSGPNLKSPQKAPQTLLPPRQDSSVCTIIARLLGLLVLGWQTCLQMLTIQQFATNPQVPEDLHRKSSVSDSPLKFPSTKYMAKISV